MNNNQLYLITKQIIQTLIPNFKVIKAYQSVIAPSGSYAVVSCAEGKTSPYPPIIKEENTDLNEDNFLDVKQKIAYQLVSSVTINFYRENANLNASALLSANYLPFVQQILFENKLGWQKTNGVINLSGEQSGAYEERAQIEIFFMYEVEKEETTNAIYKVDVEVENKDSSVEETIIVDSD